MGYQKLTGRQIQHVVDRLFVPDWTSRHERKQPTLDRKTVVEPGDMGSEDIEKMLQRLTRDSHSKATDCNRTGAMDEQGIVNTYAWKGWN